MNEFLDADWGKWLQDIELPTGPGGQAPTDGIPFCGTPPGGSGETPSSPLPTPETVLDDVPLPEFGDPLFCGF